MLYTHFSQNLFTFGTDRIKVGVRPMADIHMQSKRHLDNNQINLQTNFERPVNVCFYVLCPVDYISFN